MYISIWFLKKELNSSFPESQKELYVKYQSYGNDTKNYILCPYLRPANEKVAIVIAITPAKHAYVSPFTLLVRLYEKGSYCITHLLEYPFPRSVLVPDIEKAGLLCHTYPFEHAPEHEQISHHHGQKQDEFLWNTKSSRRYYKIVHFHGG